MTPVLVSLPFSYVEGLSKPELNILLEALNRGLNLLFSVYSESFSFFSMNNSLWLVQNEK